MIRPLGDKPLSRKELLQLYDYLLTVDRTTPNMTRVAAGRHARIKQFINRLYRESLTGEGK